MQTESSKSDENWRLPPLHPASDRDRRSPPPNWPKDNLSPKRSIDNSVPLPNLDPPSEERKGKAYVPGHGMG